MYAFDVSKKNNHTIRADKFCALVELLFFGSCVLFFFFFFVKLLIYFHFNLMNIVLHEFQKVSINLSVIYFSLFFSLSCRCKKVYFTAFFISFVLSVFFP